MRVAIIQPPLLLTTVPPPAETVAGGAGADQMASRGDHTHPRLTSTNIDTTLADGTKTIVFTRSFDKEPSPVITLVEAGTTAPVTWRVQSWVMTGPLYTGAVIYGQRSRALPAVIALLGTLINYEPWVAAANTKFSAIMLASSQP